MSENIYGTVRSNEGFYLGDICYVLDSELYHGVWGDKHGYQDGVFTDPKSGMRFAVARTLFGDGCYNGSDGRSYPVDSGTLGVVPLELVKEDNPWLDGGRVVREPGAVQFESENGSFIFNMPSGENVYIETGVDDEDDDEWNEEYYDVWDGDEDEEEC